MLQIIGYFISQTVKCVFADDLFDKYFFSIRLRLIRACLTVEVSYNGVPLTLDFFREIDLSTNRKIVHENSFQPKFTEGLEKIESQSTFIRKHCFFFIHQKALLFGGTVEIRVARFDKGRTSNGMEWKTVFPYSILAIIFHSISIPY